MISQAINKRGCVRISVSSFVVVLVTACAQKQAKPPRQAVPVTVAVARRIKVPYTVEANGLVTPMQTAVVAPQVDGIITRVAFREGDNVTRSQILFQIDPRPYRAAYQQALAALARDQAMAENAQAEVARYTKLVQQDYVTKEQADQQQANAAAATATVAADQAAIANAKFNLDNTIIRAPISGRTGSLLVREGNLVHASGSTPLVVINQITPILVRFAVPASGLPLIQRYGASGGLPVLAVPDSTQSRREAKNDTSAGVTPGMGASAAPDGDTSMKHQHRNQGGKRGGDTAGTNISAGVRGTLSFIDNAVDTTTGTVILKATFANNNMALWTGQFVAVSLNLFVEQNALVVPAQAVTTGQQGAYVYVVDSSGAARQRPVTVERTAGNRVVIASGLNDGEKVVTEGQSRLTPGAQVSVRPASDSASGGKGASGRHRSRQ